MLLKRIRSGSLAAAEEAESLLAGPLDLAAETAIRRHLARFYCESDVSLSGTTVSGGRNYYQALDHLGWLYRTNAHDGETALAYADCLANVGYHRECLDLLTALEAAGGGSLRANLRFIRGKVHYFAGALDDALHSLGASMDAAAALAGPGSAQAKPRMLDAIACFAARIHVNQGNLEKALGLIEMLPPAQRSDYLQRTHRRAQALQRRASSSPDHRGAPLPNPCFCCVKYGDKYGAEYVNKLKSMLDRHAKAAFPLICLTEDGRGLDSDIGIVDIAGRGLQGWWAKLNLFDKDLKLPGDSVIYLDLDTVVIGDLSFLHETGSAFRIYEHGMMPSFNSSVMAFERAAGFALFDRLSPGDIDRYQSDQDWIEACMPDLEIFEHRLIRNYRSLRPKAALADLQASGARIVTFPTMPKPHQVADDWVRASWR